MKRFDFLKSAPPDVVDRALSIRIPPELRTPVGALCTAMLVVFAWWGAERYWLGNALREEASAQRRLMESRADLAAARLLRTNVDQMLTLDRRLREIRASGSVLASHLTDIGNHVPEHAWLTSIASRDTGIEITGEADGFAALSQTITDLMSSKAASSPSLIRAARDDRDTNLLAFTVHLEKEPDATP